VSLDAILAAITASGDAAVAQAHADLEAQLRQIEAEAEAQARVRFEAACREALFPVGRECARLLHRARLESLHLLGQARHELVAAALVEIRQRLMHVRQQAGYAVLLQRLLHEVLDALGSEEVAANPPHVLLDARDEALVRACLRADGVAARATLETSLECWGGVIVRSGDGRITVDNRLETRLERARPVLQQELAAAFERAAAGEPTAGLAAGEAGAGRGSDVRL
jgi:vacuolar-type H+-ATPase subunit E/Vma4